MGKQKFQRGNNKNEEGNSLNSKLSEETIFLGGSSFNLGGAMFQWGRYWGVYSDFLLENGPHKVYLSDHDRTKRSDTLN